MTERVISEDLSDIFSLHKCNFCEFRTSSLQAILSHVRKHQVKLKNEQFCCELSNVEKFECHLCNFKSNLKVTIDRHANLVHSDVNCLNPKMEVKCYKCDECHFETYSLLVFAKHVYEKEHDMDEDLKLKWEFKRENNQWFEGEHYPYKTIRKTRLKNHIFRNYSLRTRFLQTHRNTEEMQWLEYGNCSFETKRNCTVKAHVLHKDVGSSEDINQFKCKKCFYQANDRPDFLKHFLKNHIKKRKKWFECEKCPFSSKLKPNLNRHILSKHSNDGVKWFKCEQCPFDSETQDDLKKQHVSEWFQCEHCPYKVKRKGDLKRHNLTKHVHLLKEDCLKCEQCAYRSKRQQSLERHVLLHHMEKVGLRLCRWQGFYCNEEKTVLKANIINEHVDTKKINWFKCDKCKFTCEMEAYLKEHVLLKHTGKWFKCKYCSHKVKKKGWLKMHVLKKHPNPRKIRRYKCEKCMYKTKVKRNLIKHMLRKHVDEEERKPSQRSLP